MPNLYHCLKTIRERVVHYFNTSIGFKRSRIEIFVIVVPMIVLVLQILGAWEIWTYTSNKPVFLGRYSRDYFYPAVAYHLLLFAWTFLVLWVLATVRKRGVNDFIQIIRYFESFSKLYWGLLLLLWSAWIVFLSVFTTKVTILQILAISATLGSISLWIFYVDRQHNNLPHFKFPWNFDWLVDREIQIAYSVPPILSLLRSIILVGCILLSWVIAFHGGFLGQDYFGTAVTLLLLCIIPGSLIGSSLSVNHHFPLPGRLALWFAFGTGLLEIVAGLGRLFQLHVQYSVFCIAVVESGLLFFITLREHKTSRLFVRKSVSFRIRKSTFLLMISAIAGAVWIFAVSDQLAMFRYAPSRDTWNYSKTTVWLLNHPSEPLSPRRILGTMNPRMFTNSWLFAISVLTWAQPIEPAQLITVNLNPLLTSIGLAAIYFLAYAVSSEKRKVAYLSVLFSVAVLGLALILSHVDKLTHKSVPEVFLIRIADDKFVGFFLLLPITLGIMYKYFIGEQKKLIYPLLISLVGLTLSHPMGIASFGMCMAGFGIFHFLTNPRSVIIKRWVLIGSIAFVLLVFAYVLDSGMLLKPSTQEMIFASTRNASISTSEVVEGVSLDDFLFDEPQQKRKYSEITLPTIFLENRYTPLLQVSIVVAFFLAFISWRKTSTQFLSGITIFTFFLLFMPGVDTLFAKFISREFSWRFLFQIPIGIILAMGLATISEFFTRKSYLWAHTKYMPTIVSIMLLGLLFLLIQQSMNYLEKKRAYYQTDIPSSKAWDVLEKLDEIADEETLIMAPPYLNSMIIGYGKGRVFYTKGADLSDAGVEWLSRFFSTSDALVSIQDQAYMYLLIKEFDFKILIMPRMSMLNEEIFLSCKSFHLIGENESFLIFKIEETLCWPMESLECSNSS